MVAAVPRRTCTGRSRRDRGSRPGPPRMSRRWRGVTSAGAVQVSAVPVCDDAVLRVGWRRPSERSTQRSTKYQSELSRNLPGRLRRFQPDTDSAWLSRSAEWSGEHVGRGRRRASCWHLVRPRGRRQPGPRRDFQACGRGGSAAALHRRPGPAATGRRGHRRARLAGWGRWREPSAVSRRPAGLRRRGRGGRAPDRGHRRPRGTPGPAAQATRVPVPAPWSRCGRHGASNRRSQRSCAATVSWEIFASGARSA
jgi:hypothetical protein